MLPPRLPQSCSPEQLSIDRNSQGTERHQDCSHGRVRQSPPFRASQKRVERDEHRFGVQRQRLGIRRGTRFCRLVGTEACGAREFSRSYHHAYCRKTIALQVVEATQVRRHPSHPMHNSVALVVRVLRRHESRVVPLTSSSRDGDRVKRGEPMPYAVPAGARDRLNRSNRLRIGRVAQPVTRCRK